MHMENNDSDQHSGLWQSSEGTTGDSVPTSFNTQHTYFLVNKLQEFGVGSR